MSGHIVGLASNEAGRGARQPTPSKLDGCPSCMNYGWRPAGGGVPPWLVCLLQPPMFKKQFVLDRAECAHFRERR
jgi:hypothetical protein